MPAAARASQTLYEVLGVSSSASDEDLRRAYKVLAKRYHPDLNPNNAQAELMFKMVSRAFEVLSDPQKRASYDASISEDERTSLNGPRGAAGAKRRPDVVLGVFVLMLILAVVFFFVDTPKGIYFLVVAIALEIRNSIEKLREDIRR